MKRKIIVIGMLAGLAAGCSQENAPSEKLAEEATEIVKAAAGEQTAELDAAAPGPWAPRDECGKLEGAEPFLAMLRGAVEARDPQALGTLVADDVKLDFGGGAGREELLARLETAEGLSWDTMASMLALGCSANAQGGLTIPWYFDQEMAVDPYAGMIVTGENIPMRETASEDAPVIDRLSWEAVEVIFETDNRVEGWRHVRLPATETQAERDGWIEVRNLRAVLDYRLIASSRNGRWRITALIAGD